MVSYAVIDKSQYEAHETAPVTDNYKEVVFIGNPNSKVKQLLDGQGVIFTSKVSNPSSMLYIVDGSQTLDTTTKKEMQKQIAKGADVWIWGITPKTVNGYNEILPVPVALDVLKRSSFLPVQKHGCVGLTIQISISANFRKRMPATIH